MFKIFTGFLSGLFAGFLPGLALSPEFFFITSMILFVSMILFFFVFHLGLREFQK